MHVGQYCIILISSDYPILQNDVPSFNFALNFNWFYCHVFGQSKMFKLNFPITANLLAYWLSLPFKKFKKFSTTCGNLLLLMLKLKNAWFANSPVAASMEYANKPLNALTPGISYKRYYDMYSKHLVIFFCLVKSGNKTSSYGFPI